MNILRILKENLNNFKADLKEIKPMLKCMFDFEKNIASQNNVNHNEFMQSGNFLLLRSTLNERWNVLNKFGAYPNMIKALKI